MSQENVGWRSAPSRPPGYHVRYQTERSELKLNLERLSELRSPRFGLRARYRTQEVAGSSPASSISKKALLKGTFVVGRGSPAPERE